ncbi:hypothetical protein ACHAXN_003355 [Cyclotella atomus]
MKTSVLLSTLLFSAVRVEGHLRSSGRSLSNGNSTLSNDGLTSLIFEDDQSDSNASDDSIVTSNNTRTRSTNDCSSGQRELIIKIKTDMFGWETSWVLKGNGVTKRSPSYESNQEYTHQYCLNIGMYRFTMKDLFEEFNGYYKVFVQDANGYRVAVAGTNFGSKVQHIIDVGQTESVMTERDVLYLEAHNTRRMDWHARYNKEYVPLRWSQGLKDSSMEYAIKLLDTCTTGTPDHDPNNPFGENLARNKGSGSWGQLYSPDKILNRFVEREVGLPWARNGHLTNALWRATKYVGCAEAEKSYPVKNSRGVEIMNTCRVQVCRYAKPGNCGMAKFKSSQGKVDWETAMMQDDSPCEPACPPEGCFN